MGASQSSSSTSSLHKKEEDCEKKWNHDLHKKYNNHWRWKPGMPRYKNPKLNDAGIEQRKLELQHDRPASTKQPYRNSSGDVYEKYADLDAYYSVSREYPRRLVVQATKEARDDTRPRHWRHTKIDGRTPLIIRLAELCQNPLGLEEYDLGYDPDSIDTTLMPKKGVPRRVWEGFRKFIHHVLSIFFTLTLAWIIQGLLSFDIITEPWSSEAGDDYEGYDNVHWEWPRHAINKLDQAPDNKKSQSKLAVEGIPRCLVIRNESGEWEVKLTSELRDEKTGMLPPYVFLSFSRGNYRADDAPLKQFFRQMAGRILDHENKTHPDEPQVNAFWADVECVRKSPEPDYIEDVNTICDSVRVAKRVYILLPADTKKEKETWGKRVWTLPEVLLAAEKIEYCITPSWSDPGLFGQEEFRKVSLTDMYRSFWGKLPAISQTSLIRNNTDRQLSEQQLTRSPSLGNSDGKHEDVIRLLVDHYTNRVKLGELQLFAFAVQAMAQMLSGEDEGADTRNMAYAAMGLLAYRLTPDTEENAFTAIARLSLVNDSNRLLERLLCLWPSYTSASYGGPIYFSPKMKENQAFAGGQALLQNIADQDQYSVHLWDIQPSCDVVGIGNDKYTPTVIVDGCKGVPIRWKSFPRVRYVQNFRRFRASISQIVVWLGSWFLLAGFNLFATVVSLAFANLHAADKISITGYMRGIAVYVAVSWMISWFSPSAVRQLCSGGSNGLSNYLVGFEGTMTLREIETAIYGNYNARLSYAPSSTVFSQSVRHKELRMGRDRDERGELIGPKHWEEWREKLKVPKHYRLFTIVDTGDMSVSVIAAERPPVVALICGREGGMVRALLCSWRFETNCLYRESVVRMRSSIQQEASPNDWLKISLATQGDVGRTQASWKRQHPSSNGNHEHPVDHPSHFG